jgi:hypothetical protein
MPRNRVPLAALLLLIVSIDVLSPYGSAVFLPKPVDTVIDLLWIALNGAAASCGVLLVHTWWLERSR